MSPGFQPKSDEIVAMLRELLSQTTLDSKGMSVTITAPSYAQQMSLLGLLANIRDRVV